MNPIDVCATVAIQTFPDVLISTSAGVLRYPVVMVAIAGSETGGTWDASAAGDCGLGGLSCGDCMFGGTAATSWGLWQIHNVHATYLQQQTGSADPCVWASWCYQPLNCAQAALALVGTAPTAQALADTWTTFADGSWAAHVPDAGVAVDLAYQRAQQGGGSTPPPPQPQKPVTAGVLVGLAVALGAAAVVLAEYGAFRWVESAVRKASGGAAWRR